MNWHSDPVDARRQNVRARVAAEHRDVAFLQPCGAIHLQTGEFSIPRTERRTTRPTAGANEQYISCSNAHASLLLPCIQVFGGDRSARFEIVDAFEQRRIDENAARHHALLQIFDTELLCATADDIRL